MTEKYYKEDFDDNLERFKKVSKLLKYSLTSLRDLYDRTNDTVLTKKIKDNTFNDIVNFKNNEDRMVSIKEYDKKKFNGELPIFIYRLGIYFLISDEFFYLHTQPKRCIVLRV